MQAEQANNLLDAAGKCAAATQALFEALDQRNAGQLSDEEAITVARDYIAAKEGFDSSIMTRGLIP